MRFSPRLIILARIESGDDYYDLIELPNGKHIPVPIAVKLVGKSKVAKIPLAKRRRDNMFFYCPECGKTSFYKCWEHNSLDERVNEEKERYFLNLIKAGKYSKLRYIVAELEEETEVVIE